MSQPGTANCTELYFTNEIDHFSWAATPTGAFTYQQRYFVNDQYWRNGTAGSIFFYAGNEADVTLYVNNTGLMWENAAQHGALLVFAEHRYVMARAKG
jgi:lysosomal Pro-X carboxypeptidase